jgi:hypothetical protein
LMSVVLSYAMRKLENTAVTLPNKSLAKSSGLHSTN